MSGQPSPAELVESKRALRRWARALPPAIEAESSAVVEALVPWLRARPGDGVLIYFAMPGEVFVNALEDRVRNPLFVTRTPDAGPLTVHAVDAPRERHRFGFEQPAKSSPEVGPSAVSVVLVPGLCFDGLGGRLGHGMAYYDRLLAAHPDAVRVGVTLERRLVDRVPLEPHDVLMHWLVTERGLREVRPDGSR